MPKGNPNPKSRAGKPNKTTVQLREFLLKVWTDYTAEQFLADLMALPPHPRLILMEKFAHFIAPTMQSTTVDVTGNAPEKSIFDRLTQLAEQFAPAE